MALSAEKRAAEPVQAEEARARRVLRARRLRGADTEPHAKALRLIGIGIAAMAVLAGAAGGAALMWRDAGDARAPEIVEIAAPVVPAASVIESVDDIAALETFRDASPTRSQAGDAAAAAVSDGNASLASCDLGGESRGQEAAGVVTGAGAACAEPPAAIAEQIAASD